MRAVEVREEPALSSQKRKKERWVLDEGGVLARSHQQRRGVGDGHWIGHDVPIVGVASTKRENKEEREEGGGVRGWDIEKSRNTLCGHV